MSVRDVLPGSFFVALVFAHVVEHILHVLVVFELVDELVDGFALFGRNLFEVVGDAFEFGTYYFVAVFFEIALDAGVFLECAVEHYFIFFGLDFVHSVVDELKFEVFEVHAFGKEITIAAKAGGPDPSTNPRLRALMQNAKAANMPKDTVERAIKKATDKDAGDYKEITYEGYGPHGIAIFVEAATDNNTRTVANVRSYFNKHGGSLGTQGSLGLVEGSGPPALAAMVISLPMRVKVRDMLPQRLSLRALRYSNALPISVCYVGFL